MPKLKPRATPNTAVRVDLPIDMDDAIESAASRHKTTKRKIIIAAIGKYLPELKGKPAKEEAA